MEPVEDTQANDLTSGEEAPVTNAECRYTAAVDMEAKIISLESQLAVVESQLAAEQQQMKTLTIDALIAATVKKGLVEQFESMITQHELVTSDEVYDIASECVSDEMPCIETEVQEYIDYNVEMLDSSDVEDLIRENEKVSVTRDDVEEMILEAVGTLLTVAELESTIERQNERISMIEDKLSNIGDLLV